MQVISSIPKLRKVLAKAKIAKKTVGFIATMGALHQGHLSLVTQAKKECDFVVVSIFVNPTQFGKHEDLTKYPRNLVKDKQLLKKAKTDLLFYPKESALYPKDFSTYVEETVLSKLLCGLSRPGHFRGVVTIVTKLFNLVNPDIAYFGAKDHQQAQIIQRVVKDLNFNIKVKIMPIIRELDGIAMSSRNRYLTLAQRKTARCLIQALKKAQTRVKQGEFSAAKLKAIIRQYLNSFTGIKIDYVKIVDPKTLEKISQVKKQALITLAVFVGTTRLIDNCLIRR